MVTSQHCVFMPCTLCKGDSPHLNITLASLAHHRPADNARIPGGQKRQIEPFSTKNGRPSHPRTETATFKNRKKNDRVGYCHASSLRIQAVYTFYEHYFIGAHSCFTCQRCARLALKAPERLRPKIRLSFGASTISGLRE